MSTTAPGAGAAQRPPAAPGAAGKQNEAGAAGEGILKARGLLIQMRHGL
jgi:hypothetical protein